MKLGKITTIILALCMLATLMVMPTSAAKTESTVGMIDGSFEEWGTTGALEGWVLSGAASISPADDVKADGNYSAKIQATGEQARVAFYQNIGKLPLGSTYTVSVKLNAKNFSGSGARLMVRFGSNGGSPYWGPSETVKAATNGWKELTVKGTVNETSAELDAFVVLDIMAGSADYEIYMDACKVDEEIVRVEFTNGDFEKGGTDWTFAGDATAEDCIITENGNSYVKFTKNGQRMLTSVSNMTAGTTYRLCFDLCTNADQIFYVDFGDSSRIIYSGQKNSNTNGAWQHWTYVWTNGTNTRESFRFMFNGAATTVTDPYVMFDNISIEEADEEEGNAIKKWTFKVQNATVTRSDDAFGDGHSLRVINNGNGDETVTSSDDVQIKCIDSIPASTYEFSVYVKNVSLSGAGSIILRPSDQAYEIETSTLPKNEWVRISTISKGDTPQIYIRDVGEVLIDKISFRQITEPVVTYAKANGAFSDKLTNGGTVSVTMPAEEGDMVVFAIYSRSNNVTALADVKVQEITEADVTKGYADFTLAADTLDDFDSVDYYAKLLVFQGGTLKPMQKATLLTK